MAVEVSDWSIALVGDLILGEPDPDFFFERARDTLRARDLVIGHIEVPHTRRGRELQFDVPAIPSDPDHLAALSRAGFHLATLAGNHIYDYGLEGIADTVSGLAAVGVETCGAGVDLERARRPARLERHGVQVCVLSYNCVGPRESWASEDKPGCAYVRVLGKDGRENPGPGVPDLLDAYAQPESLRAMQDDIGRLKAEGVCVIVALHKGIVHTPARLAGYERPLAHAAAEAGASLVVGHHAHILRGIEVAGDCPIFHGLGNFVTVTQALNVDNAHPGRRAWALKRRELFGFTPDPSYLNYPFHPESKHALIADCRVESRGRIRGGFLPCWIQPSGQPEIVGRDARGQAVFDYVTNISRAEGLTTEFAWDGDRVVFE
jgi:poly-gamma-glutamate capsule biosynthesis protein CapA/YwtB (metallophosphatase superfamily)